LPSTAKRLLVGTWRYRSLCRRMRVGRACPQAVASCGGRGPVRSPPLPASDPACRATIRSLLSGCRHPVAQQPGDSRSGADAANSARRWPRRRRGIRRNGAIETITADNVVVSAGARGPRPSNTCSRPRQGPARPGSARANAPASCCFPIASRNSGIRTESSSSPSEASASRQNVPWVRVEGH
jgi:hypothetical protein